MNSKTKDLNDQLIQKMQVEELKEMVSNLQFETFIRETDIFDLDDESDINDSSEFISADNENRPS
jgi:hypothetical protein